MSEHGHDRHDTHAAALGDGDMGWAFGITENAVMLLDGERRPLRVNQADNRQDQQPLTHLQYRRRQLANSFLLLADDTLALLDKAGRYRVGNPVGGGFVEIEYPIQ